MSAALTTTTTTTTTTTDYHLKTLIRLRVVKNPFRMLAQHVKRENMYDASYKKLKNSCWG